MQEIFLAKYAAPAPASLIPFPSMIDEPLQAVAEDQTPYDAPKKQARAVKTAALTINRSRALLIPP